MMFRKIIQILNRLHKHSPYHIGKHLSIAIDGEDLWNMSDIELFNSLEKYEIELEMDVHHEDDVEKIIKESMNLSSEDLLEEE